MTLCQLSPSPIHSVLFHRHCHLDCTQNAPIPEANIMTFDNLLFSLVWDDLPQSYSRRKFEFESRRRPISPDSLRSGNYRKSLEVLEFNLHVKAHVKTSIKSTARGTNARRFLGTCGSCWFQQYSATVYTGAFQHRSTSRGVDLISSCRRFRLNLL